MRHPDAALLRAWRIYVAVLGFGGAWSVASAAEEKPGQAAAFAPPPSGRAAIRQVTQEAYRYDPTIRQKMLAEKTPGTGVLIKDPDIVQMAAVVVSESKDQPGVAKAIDRDRRTREANKPSLANGVSVLSRPTIDIGVRPHKDTLPFGPPTPRWSIIDFKW
jgi:hypothetical protein